MEILCVKIKRRIKMGNLKRRIIHVTSIYTDLMKVVNQDVEEGATKIVNSRYSIGFGNFKKSKTDYRRRITFSTNKAW